MPNSFRLKPKPFYPGVFVDDTVERKQNSDLDFDSKGLECSRQLREDDLASSIQFRECDIDYTQCPNQNCIKKLV